MTAFEQIIKHIEDNKSFVLEAGAGSGKTYTLIQTLNYLIENKGTNIKYHNQKIICITYTNVAKNEIIERLEHNPLVLVSTIHEFLWNCIKPFQKQLKIELCRLNEIRYNLDIANDKDSRYTENLSDRIKFIQSVDYDDTAFRDFEKGLLHHDDVIILFQMLIESNTLLTTILSQKHPYILVDEYQDTAEETIVALLDFLLERNIGNIVIGFYGDSHQKIYESGIGNLEKYYNNDAFKKIELVKKEENYRSSKEVVRLLNNFRTNIQQKEQKEIIGDVKFIYCNYSPPRITKINRKGETVFDETITNYENRIKPQKNINYDNVISKLESLGWGFLESSQDKILVIANSRVASRAGFGNLYNSYNRRYGQSTKEQLLDRTHGMVKYFVGYRDKKTSQEKEIGIEHLIYFWKNKNYNEVIRFLKKHSNLFNEKHLIHQHKKIITEILNELEILRETKSIKEVLNFVEKKNILIKSDNFNRFLEKINIDLDSITDEKTKEKVKNEKELYNSLINIPYLEIIDFFKHTQNHTVFSTKHSTKGEEYRNVLTVIDDTEWKQEYNFQNFFNDSEEKEDRKLRTRNLFYVECSRAKENLVVLSLSEMNDVALEKIKNWFGSDNVVPTEKFIK